MNRQQYPSRGWVHERGRGREECLVTFARAKRVLLTLESDGRIAATIGEEIWPTAGKIIAQFFLGPGMGRAAVADWINAAVLAYEAEKGAS